ncbi:hypothetical protein [Janthinobacterium sp. LB3P112]|uniref:hypothetical protein n=1 Tax=Janthinobacterium sp. LB3P112 TaxID=3424196 RepID=UPI003F2626E6
MTDMLLALDKLVSINTTGGVRSGASAAAPWARAPVTFKAPAAVTPAAAPRQLASTVRRVAAPMDEWESF